MPKIRDNARHGRCTFTDASSPYTDIFSLLQHVIDTHTHAYLNGDWCFINALLGLSLRRAPTHVTFAVLTETISALSSLAHEHTDTLRSMIAHRNSYQLIANVLYLRHYMCMKG